MHSLFACLTLLFDLTILIFLLLASQDTFESADSVCDAKIRQWLHDRKKHADPKRKRSRGKKNVSVVTLEGNTPKRHTRSSRHSKREEQTKFFSPVASSMVVTPVAQHVKQKNIIRVKQKRNKKTIPMVTLLACFFLFDYCLLLLC